LSEILQVLWYSDTPTCATGFGQVAKNLLKALHATGKYHFDVIGINHGGQPYSHAEFPYDIYPAINPLTTDEKFRDPYARQLLVDMAASGRYDIVFMLQDHFVVQTLMEALLKVRDNLPTERKFTTVYYTPIDGRIKKEWVTEVIAKMDQSILYNEYGKKQCIDLVPDLKDDLQVIFHGVDKATFYPLPEVEKKQFHDKFFAKHKDKFVVLNVNRNQPRKDLHRTMAAFSLFHKKHPNTFLFILAQARDVGGDLLEIAKQYGLEYDVDWACPSPGAYGANQGYPIEIVNRIYNISDMVVSSTLGEGFGLSTVEGMATKKPILFPRNTSLVEIIGENEERGWFCKSGETINDFICLGGGDNNILRPVVNVVDMAEKMEYIYTHPDEAQAKVERAFAEVWTWDQVGEQWKAVFNKAEVILNQLRAPVVSQGRNEPCQCGSGKKFKHCHGA
jgi:D-inositol-3-phosphate glycosyltransferase